MLEPLPGTSNSNLQIRRLREFSMVDMKKSKRILILGKSESGKSWLTLNIMHHYHVDHHIPECKIFSGTEADSPHFEGYVPKCSIEDDMNLDTLDYIKEFTTNRMKDLTKEEKKKLRKSGLMDKLVIVDDCTDTARDWIQSRAIKWLFFKSRHYDITSILISHDPIDGTPPFMRKNCDYVFIFNTGIVNEQEKIFKNYVTMVETLSDFRQLMQIYCRNYSCLVIDHTILDAEKIEDCVFWYRAPPTPPFKFGSAAWWKAASLMNKKSDEEINNPLLSHHLEASNQHHTQTRETLQGKEKEKMKEKEKQILNLEKLKIAYDELAKDGDIEFVY